MQVHLVKNEDGVYEWMMIEMQGEIVNSGRPFDGEMICNIGWRKDNSEALMLIGHHLVEGKVSKLEKPLLVAVPEQQHNGQKALVVEGIVRKRLLFKLRPKPIVTKQLMKRAQLDKGRAAEQDKENE